MVEKKSVRAPLSELGTSVWRYKRTVLETGVIGTLVGIIPGVDEDIGVCESYAAAKRQSKEHDEFGKSPRRGPIPSNVDFTAFFTRPVSATFAILIALIILRSIPPVHRLFQF